MKDLMTNLSVDKVKDTFYSGGPVCTTTCGTYLFCIFGATVNIIDIKAGTTFAQINTEDEEITCITVSPDDKYLITAHRNLLLKQWNWKDNICMRTWKATHTAPIQSMAFDATSTLLATGGSDFVCKIWDINAQYCTHNLKGSQGVIKYVKFYSYLNKLHLYTGSEDAKIRVYDLYKSELIHTLESHFSSITSFEFIDNGNRLISSSRDNVIIIWDLITYQTIKTIPVYEGIESIVVLPNEKYVNFFNETIKYDCDTCFLTFGNEGLLKIWDWKTAKLVYKQNEIDSFKIENIREKDSNLQQCIIQAFYVSSIDTLVVVTIDRLIVFLKMNKEKIVESEKQFIGHHGEILDATICNKDGSVIAVATNSELIKVYNKLNWNCQLLKGHKDIVICLNSFYKNDNSYLASSSKDSTIRIWKLNQETCLFYCVAVANGHTKDVGSICFSRLNLTFIVSGSIDTTIKYWQINEKLFSIDKFVQLNVEFTQMAHEKDVNSICVSPNDKLMATASSDRTAKLWDLPSGRLLNTFKGHKRGIWCVQFSPVEQVIATSSADGTIKLWSILDSSCIRTFEGHETSVLKLLFISNGAQLISSASDGLLKIWNTKTSECMKTYDEHEDKIWALCIDQNEDICVTGGADSKLILWKNTTDQVNEENQDKLNEIILQEQKMFNCIKDKNYKKALKLAIILDRPYKCYEILNELLNNENGKQDLRDIILQLREDHLESLLKYASQWNTNSKYCHNAQALIEVILNNFPPEKLLKFNDITGLIEKCLPYTERHMSRMNRLMQQIMFIDFAWTNMKLDDKNIDIS